MKFQDSSFNGLKVTVGTKSVTHPRTHSRMHARSKSNMPHQLFQSWGHNHDKCGNNTAFTSQHVKIVSRFVEVRNKANMYLEIKTRRNKIANAFAETLKFNRFVCMLKEKHQNQEAILFF